MTDIDQLNAMITLSNVGVKKPSQDTWFTFAHQKQHVFSLAAKLVIEYDWDAEDAINHAQDFVDTFYKMKLEKKI